MEKLKNLSNIQKITLAILTTFILVIVILLTGKFAYSYLGADIDEDSITRGEITVSGDALIFSTGNGLSLSANTDNFNGTSGNLSSSTNPSVRIVASSKNGNATAEYVAGFIIKENTYQYTTAEKTPELILTIRDEADNLISSAEGLNFVTIAGVSGFDITELKGTFTVEENHSISTTSTTSGTTHVWTFTLTFINLETDQSLNENSKLLIDAILQTDKLESSETLASYIISTYGTDTNLLLHDESLVNGAGDDSYRFVGADPNNYVCFGSDAEVCPEDNLYRIIGVFNDQVKLIKSTIASSTLLGTDGDYKSGNIYYWNNNTKSNNWVESRLNSMNLNTNFTNALGSDWVNKIASAPWYIGGMTLENGAKTNARTAYDYEVGTNADKTKIYNEKIGLIYISDYYYAAPQSYWTLPGSSESAETDYRKAKDENWMHLGQSEWSITRQSNQTDSTIHIFMDGIVSGAHVVYSSNINVRPAFYLKSDVKMVSGKGTSTEPYRIS